MLGQIAEREKTHLSSLKVENTQNSSVINAFQENHLIRYAVLSQADELVSLQKRFLLAHSFRDFILWWLQEKSAWKSKKYTSHSQKAKAEKIRVPSNLPKCTPNNMKTCH